MRKNTQLRCFGLILIILFWVSILILNFQSSKNYVQKIWNFPQKTSDYLDEERLFLSQNKISNSFFLDLPLIENNSLMAVSTPVFLSFKTFGILIDEENPESTKEIVEYTVEKGDTLSGIAEKFNIDVNTLIWANNKKEKTIKPGEVLFVLPVKGVLHYAKKGEIISELAKKYESEAQKIADFNNFSIDEELFEGEVLIIPDGKLADIPQEKRNKTYIGDSNFKTGFSFYPYGQCTWWVAQKKAVGKWGNAKNWLKNALLDNFSVCMGSDCQPKEGAVISLKGHPVYGHVAYVEEVKENKVLISEMNYLGVGNINYRTFRIGDKRILGYIY